MATIRARLGHITLNVANTRPILYVNQTREAEKTRARLRAYDIDFQERPTTEPFVSLHWSGIVYTDVFGTADFLMFAGRLPIDSDCRRLGVIIQMPGTSGSNWPGAT